MPLTRLRATLAAAIIAAGLSWSSPSDAFIDDLASFVVSDEQMMQLGEQSFAQIKQQEKISRDPALNRQVQEIGRRIVEVADTNIPADQWEFVVFDSPQINAFALPGGHVGVYTGLMKVAENDDQLAAVIGHEVAHVTEDHSKERVGTGTATNVGVSVLSAILGGDSAMGQQIASTVFGLGAEYGIARPFSRSHENEADAVGLRYMAEAGYDPRAAIDFWQNMVRAKGGDAPPGWLSTHPTDQQRIDALKQQVQQMGY